MGGGEWLPGLAPPFYIILPLRYGTSQIMSAAEFATSTADPGDLALVFHAHYERSEDTKEQLQERFDSAKKWYEYFEPNAR